MTVAGGRWISPADAGDETPYPNHRHLDDLAALTSTTFDVVVVGGGGAGAVAAIEAADGGASVIVLEAAAFPGGNTQVSGGTLRTIDDAVAATEHLVHLAQGATPRAVIEAFVSGVSEIRGWIEAHGGTVDVRPGPADPRGRLFPLSLPGTSFPYYPGGNGLGPRALVAARRQGRENGAALWDLLAHNLAERDIPVVLGAHVRRLCVDGERRVTGVEVDTVSGSGDGGAGSLRVNASRAVILACGGFAYDNEIMTQYYGLPLPTVCLPGRSNGDGVRLAIDAGADLWHMNAAACSVGYRLPGLDAGIQAKMPDYGFVMVDQRARRYVCETSLENHNAIFAMTAQDPTTGEFLRTPSFLVFDEETRRAGTVAHLPHGANRHYPWSADNSDEVERGWISRAATVRELAASLGLDPGALEECVSTFNGQADGDGDGLGRDASKMRAIDQPPFYGAAVYPIIVNTQGGPRRDEAGRILRPDGTPIPGLLGAGELGSMWNRLYPGAGNLSECLVSGRAAAISALR